MSSWPIKGSRLRCRGQIPEKRSAVLFFSQKQKLNQHPPKPPKRLLKHIWDVLWRNIRDFFWQNGPQNGKIEKIEKSKLLKNCTLKWKITLESVIRDPSWVQISCNTSCNFLRFFFVPLCYFWQDFVWSLIIIKENSSEIERGNNSFKNFLFWTC